MQKKPHDQQAAPQGGPQPDLPAQMQQAGVTDPAHQQAAQQAVARGLGKGELLGWVGAYGPAILDVVKRLLELTGNRSDPGVGSPPAPTA